MESISVDRDKTGMILKIEHHSVKQESPRRRTWTYALTNQYRKSHKEKNGIKRSLALMLFQ